MTHEHTLSTDCPCGPTVEDYRVPAETQGVDPGKVTITCNDAGDCVAVTRTDSEGRILKVLWERGTRPAPCVSCAGMARRMTLMQNALRLVRHGIQIGAIKCGTVPPLGGGEPRDSVATIVDKALQS